MLTLIMPKDELELRVRVQNIEDFLLKLGKQLSGG